MRTDYVIDLTCKIISNISIIISTHMSMYGKDVLHIMECISVESSSDADDWHV